MTALANNDESHFKSVLEVGKFENDSPFNYYNMTFSKLVISAKIRGAEPNVNNSVYYHGGLSY